MRARTVSDARLRGMLSLLCGVVFLAAPCTGADDTRSGSNPDATSTDNARVGGTLRVVIPRHPLSLAGHSYGATLDPQTDWWWDSFEVFRCCLLRTLLAHPGLPTEHGGSELHPDLAAEMPRVSNDGLTWTFRLKAGLTYGPPLQDRRIVASDFIRALEREAVMASTEETYAFYYSVIEGFDDMANGEADSISGLEAPDDSTLIVHVSRPAGHLANLFAMPATAPIPANPSDPSAGLGVAEGVDAYGRFLVASGPYMIEGSRDLDLSVPPDERIPISGYAPRRSLTLVRNPSWDRRTDSLRPAYLDRIEFTIGPPIQDAVGMIERGEADLYVFDDPAPQLRPSIVERYLHHPELGVEVHMGSRDLVRYITMNLAVRPLDDVHVRRAISYAIDKDALLELRGGPTVGDVAGHLVLDSLENGLLTFYDPYPTSLTDARSEMSRSAYDDDGDGRCDHEVCSDLLMLANAGLFTDMEALADSVREDLKAIGIRLRIEAVASDPFFDRLADVRAKVPMAISPSWQKDILNASTFFTPLFSSESIPGRTQSLDEQNFSLVGAPRAQLRDWGYDVTTVPSIDAKIDECLALVGDFQFRCWAEADQRLMAKVVPGIPFVFEKKVQLVSDRVVAYSFAQFSISPALDRIAIASDAA